MTTKKLPNNASLTDDPAAVAATSAYPTVTTADIVQGLVDRSGNPRDTMGPRHGGTDGWCTTCQLPADRALPSGGGHPYEPMIDRTPGVHQDVDWDRAQNDPAIDVGEDQMGVSSDPAISSGLSEARWNRTANRHRSIDDQRPEL